MRYREIITGSLTEKATIVTIYSGRRDRGGRPYMVELKAWENPLKPEFHRPIQQTSVMAGDVNLRGTAHRRQVWAWPAEKATRAVSSEGR
jgi:hypothetical protein